MSRDVAFIPCSTAHSPCRSRSRECALKPPPTPGNLPASRWVPTPRQTQNPAPGQASPPTKSEVDGHRDSVSSWQMFAKFKKRKKRSSPEDEWKLAICHRVEFPLIRDVPLRGEGGQSLLAPSPLSISGTVSRCTPELAGKTRTEAGCDGGSTSHN